MKEVGKIPEWSGYVSIRSYVIGYVISLLLCLGSYWMVDQKILNGWALATTLLTLTFFQAAAQFIFFLNLGKEPKPAWNLIAFVFMLVLLLIIVIGSLLIMYSLDYRMIA
jgi:cytochrome o ubiquinol oxidase operon protein cyoD